MPCVITLSPGLSPAVTTQFVSNVRSATTLRRSALLSLARTYLFAVPLTFTLPWLLGETGIWLALPIADLLLVLVATAVLLRPGRLGMVARAA